MLHLAIRLWILLRGTKCGRKEVQKRSKNDSPRIVTKCLFTVYMLFRWFQGYFLCNQKIRKTQSNKIKPDKDSKLFLVWPHIAQGYLIVLHAYICNCKASFCCNSFQTDNIWRATSAYWRPEARSVLNIEMEDCSWKTIDS